MAIKKSQLYRSLWASCDKLRGGMDASQYKDYILTLLFIKYVSDKFKDDPYGAIAIPEGASFDDLVKLKGDKNIGEKIDILIAKLAEANNLNGVLFRGNAEESIRKNIIDHHLIKGIIGLPANLFYGTGIPACIIVLDKEDAATRTGIFIIDARSGFMKNKDKNRLREQDIYKIVTTFNSMTEIKGFSRFVPNEEIIEKNAYNLNIPRYIDSNQKEDSQSIEAHLYGGIPQSDIDNIPNFWEVFPNLKKEMFGEDRKGFYKLLVEKDNIHNTVCQNKEFLAYNKKVNEAFDSWKNYANPLLANLKSTDSNKEIISKLSERILENFSSLKLLDKYDVYQVLLSYWNETMNDDVLYIIQDENGYNAAKETEDIFEEEKSNSKKDKKKKEPKVIGW